jgi:hypothetical protein
VHDRREKFTFDIVSIRDDTVKDLVIQAQRDATYSQYNNNETCDALSSSACSYVVTNLPQLPVDLT